MKRIVINIAFSLFVSSFVSLVSVSNGRAAAAISTKKKQEIQKRQQEEVSVKKMLIQERAEREQAIQQIVSGQSEAPEVDRPSGIARQASGHITESAENSGAARPKRRLTRVSFQDGFNSSGSTDTARIQSTSQYRPQRNQVVKLSDVWKSLDVNCKAWTLMMDFEPKEITVERYIDKFKNNGAVIRKSSSYYVSRIDYFLSRDPDMQNKPFAEVLKYAAILDYDFENGEDKEAMVKSLLSPEEYDRNKSRLFK